MKNKVKKKINNVKRRVRAIICEKEINKGYEMLIKSYMNKNS
jgi:hypothetical protein